MSERALILSADPWSMPDEQTGEIRSGVTIWFCNEYRGPDDKGHGFKPTKVSGTPEVYDQLKGKVPGLFELFFGSRPGAQGKATLTLTGFKDLKPVDLFGAKSAPAAS